MFCTRKIGLFIGFGILILAGCSQSNPLKRYSHEKIAKDLLISAISAGMKLGLVKYAYQAGNYYAACMEGKKSKKVCQSLYKAMWENLKSQYKGLTIANLQDKKLWSSVNAYYLKDAVFDHCPDIKSVHLNKAGYYVAHGGWKSKTNGHQYAMPDRWQPQLSGWRYYKIMGFTQGTAETNVDTNELELQSCEYRMAIKNNPEGPSVTMYLAPTKKRFVIADMPAWEAVGVFSYVCEGHGDPRVCFFSLA